MNWYPTIYHPITKQPINLFSEEINELLDQGYNEQDLLTKPRIVGKSILTGITDIDYEMMMYLNDKQLKQLCYVNQYSYKLCYGKDSGQFWLRKFKDEQLLLPDHLNDVNWVKVYGVLRSITTYMLESNANDKSVAILNPLHKIYPIQGDKALDISHPSEQLLTLMQKHGFIDKEFRSDYNYLYTIHFWKDDDKYYVDFIRKNLGGTGSIDLYLVSQERLVNFLYEAMMTNLIVS